MGPERNCDVVMKGGITSGIVYPEAIHELSRQYRFRSIGGTSAGAIAAAATAAAEVGRQRGDASSFERFAKLPGELAEPVGPGGRSRLFTLFQPQPRLAPIYRSLVAALGKPTMTKRLFAFASGVARNYWYWTIATLLVGGAVTLLWSQFILGAGTPSPWRFALALVPGLLLTLVAAVVILAVVFVRRLLSGLPENFYGLCSGYAEPPPAPDGPQPPLTGYLYALFNRLANQPLDRPLTFGDLWWPDGRRPDPLPDGEPDDPVVRLHMMTTNLTHGRPYRLPFLGHEQRRFYYREQEFRRFFPTQVLEWLARQATAEPAYPGFQPLPPARDLPVIVAVRMSLSFPILLSAVPLYAVDYTAPEPLRRPELCLFSDGGIASNFPVHFFDGPVPRWPTLAINLRPYHRHHPDEHIHKARTNGNGLAEWWTIIDQGSGMERVTAFVSAILGAMQNWSDNTLLKVPGYRDRVVHVSLAENEGGMNLDMPSPLITELGRRGRAAARLLARDLQGMPRDDGAAVEVTWENHRWVRLRTFLALLERELVRLRRALAHREPGDRSYTDLVGRGDNDPPASYRLSARARQEAAAALADLEELAEKWPREIDFSGGAPRPNPELRVRPRI
jgi:predicted acylesterase/phospholipase RssA